jgi:hypothetical protein
VSLEKVGFVVIQLVLLAILEESVILDEASMETGQPTI